MSVVTVSREYGTGGRDFGKKLAQELGFMYADKEIARELAGKMNMNEGYIERFLDMGIPVGMSSGTGHASYSFEETQRNVNLQIESHNLLKELAKDKDIVIVGRASDIILKEYNPFRIFVYGELPAKMERIKERNLERKNLTDTMLHKEMDMIDTERYQHHALFSQIRWGEKLGYDLCINSTNVDLEKTAKAVALYIKLAFGIE